MIQVIRLSTNTSGSIFHSPISFTSSMIFPPSVCHQRLFSFALTFSLLLLLVWCRSLEAILPPTAITGKLSGEQNIYKFRQQWRPKAIPGAFTPSSKESCAICIPWCLFTFKMIFGADISEESVSSSCADDLHSSREMVGFFKCSLLKSTEN